jgi:hypothetical protein
MTPEDAERFFRADRRNEAGPPYRMTGFGEAFVADFMQGPTSSSRPKKALREGLSPIWVAFCRYETLRTTCMKGVGRADRWLSHIIHRKEPEGSIKRHTRFRTVQD